MRIRAILGSIVSASAILIVGWELGVSVPTIPVAVSTSQTGPTAPLPPSGQAAAADGTFLGGSASTPYGSVQVQVAISHGSLTDVTAVHLTDADGRSVQISNRAAPVLREEVLSAQSARVQMVSGATYTSEGYLTSLQSALDQAGFRG